MSDPLIRTIQAIDTIEEVIVERINIIFDRLEDSLEGMAHGIDEITKEDILAVLAHITSKK